MAKEKEEKVAPKSKKNNIPTIEPSEDVMQSPGFQLGFNDLAQLVQGQYGPTIQNAESPQAPTVPGYPQTITVDNNVPTGPPSGRLTAPQSQAPSQLENPSARYDASGGVSIADLASLQQANGMQAPPQGQQAPSQLMPMGQPIPTGGQQPPVAQMPPQAPQNFSNLAPGDTRPAQPYPETPFALKLMGAFLAPTRLGKIPDYIVQGIENKRTAMMEADDKAFQHFMTIWQQNPVAASQLAGTSMFNDMLERKFGMNEKDIKVIQEVASANPMNAAQMTDMLTSGRFNPTQEVTRSAGMEAKRDQAKKWTETPYKTFWNAETNEVFDPRMASIDQFRKFYKAEFKDASDWEVMIAQMHYMNNDDMYDTSASGGGIVIFNKANPKDRITLNAQDINAAGVNTKKNVQFLEMKGRNGSMGWVVVNTAKSFVDPETGEEKYQHYTISLADILNGLLKDQEDKGNPAPKEPGAFRKWISELYDAFMDGFTGNKAEHQMDPTTYALWESQRGMQGSFDQPPATPPTAGGMPQGASTGDKFIAEQLGIAQKEAQR